jgi:hypothetical protein
MIVGHENQARVSVTISKAIIMWMLSVANCLTFERVGSLTQCKKSSGRHSESGNGVAAIKLVRLRRRLGLLWRLWPGDQLHIVAFYQRENNMTHFATLRWRRLFEIIVGAHVTEKGNLVTCCSLCPKWRTGIEVLKELVLKRIGIATSFSIYKNSNTFEKCLTRFCR